MDAILRDQFAAVALNGLIEIGEIKNSTNPDSDAPTEEYRPLAKRAYRIADAMLLEREKASGVGSQE